MAKKIEVITRQMVKHEGEYWPLGTPIKVEKKEAERLIALGAAELPKPKLEEKTDSGPTAEELIEKINTAQSLEDLLALDIGDDEKRKTVQDAFAARYAELNPETAA